MRESEIKSDRGRVRELHQDISYKCICRVLTSVLLDYMLLLIDSSWCVGMFRVTNN